MLCFDVTQGRMNGAPNETRSLVIIAVSKSEDIFKKEE